MKKRKQTRRRRDAAQRRGKLGISTVIVVLIAVFLLRGHTMDQRNAAYVEELAQLQNKIDAEEARTQDIVTQHDTCSFCKGQHKKESLCCDHRVHYRNSRPRKEVSFPFSPFCSE